MDGGWSGWSHWSSCQGKNEQSRTRQCDSPLPKNGGNGCGHETMETRHCGNNKGNT